MARPSKWPLGVVLKTTLTVDYQAVYEGGKQNLKKETCK